MLFRKLEDEVTLVLHGINEKPRYQIAVLDDPDVSVLNSFAVFIVPVGRLFRFFWNQFQIIVDAVF